MKFDNIALWIVVACLGGLVGGYTTCWATRVRGLEASLNAREKTLQQWDDLIRQEREAVADIRNLSVEEMRNWVAEMDEQHQDFAELQRLYHKRELAAANPGSTYVVIELVAVVSVVFVIAWLIRDGNANAARTFHNAVAVLPSLMRAVEDRMAHSPTLPSPANSRVLGNEVPLAQQPIVREKGTVAVYYRKDAYGLIKPDDGSPILRFERIAVRKEDQKRIRPNIQVSYVLLSSDGRSFPSEIAIEA